MTNEEAIAFLSQYIDNECYTDKCQQAHHMAIYAIRAAEKCDQNATRLQRAGVWKPCKFCNGETTLYQYTKTTKLFLNTFGESAVLVTECMACPPYADCCMKGISANSAFRINFCPECGRPLTDEAWDEMKNRLEKIK